MNLKLLFSRWMSLTLWHHSYNSIFRRLLFGAYSLTTLSALFSSVQPLYKHTQRQLLIGLVQSFENPILHSCNGSFYFKTSGNHCMSILELLRTATSYVPCQSDAFMLLCSPLNCQNRVCVCPEAVSAGLGKRESCLIFVFTVG